jgi:hypothetical protein
MLSARILPLQFYPPPKNIGFSSNINCISDNFYRFLWYTPYHACNDKFSSSFSFKLMAHFTKYRWISERTVQPPLCDVPVGGLRVVNPIPAHKCRWIIAGGSSRHAAYSACIPIVLPATSAASSESVGIDISCKSQNIQAT